MEYRYGEDNFKGLDNKVYLMQDKEITVTYITKEWDKEEIVVYEYVLSNVLTELEIDLQPDSTVYVDNVLIKNSDFDDTTIRLGSFIKIVEKNVEEIVETVAIPYSTTEKPDSSILVGERKTEQAGVEGEKQTTYNVTYSNGVEISREVASEVVIKEPVDEIILVGTKEPEPEPETEPAE